MRITLPSKGDSRLSTSSDAGWLSGDLNRENRAEPGYLLSWMGNKGNLSYLYILNSGILQTCRTCTLSHTHTRTCVHARVEFVFATPHFDQLSAFGHTFQQRVHRACRNSYLFSFVDGFVAGGAQGKAVEPGVMFADGAVGVPAGRSERMWHAWRYRGSTRASTA